jgi:hypothetical protein
VVLLLGWHLERAPFLLAKSQRESCPFAMSMLGTENLTEIAAKLDIKVSGISIWAGTGLFCS